MSAGFMNFHFSFSLSLSLSLVLKKLMYVSQANISV